MTRSSLTQAIVDTPLLDEQGKLVYTWSKLFSEIGQEVPMLEMSRAQRLGVPPDTKFPDDGAGSHKPGIVAYEKDTTLLYRVVYIPVAAPPIPYVPGVRLTAVWRYFSGTLQAVQADLAGLALGTEDAGLLVEVTDFRHILRWTGATFEWGPGEDGRHDFVDCPVAPDDLTGWQLCDGTVTTYLKKDGTTGSFTTPDLTTGAYRKGGAYTGAVTAAGGTVGLTGNTDDESTHTHAIDHDHPAATSAVNSTAQNITVTAGAGNTAAGNLHTHSVDLPNLVANSGAGAAHHHGLSGVTATLAGELVKNIAVPVYFRR